METKILSIDKNSLELAKSLLESGELVAFPTETVYGLGALATDESAISKVYAVKGRPSDNPLIVHVHKDYDIEKLVKITNNYAKDIAKAFLPGPLTMVYQSRETVAKNLSCGLKTLALRVPSHQGAQEFLRFTNMPIAAPSANISKHVSPVTAEHVFADFNGKIPLILQGGRSEGGIESTVLDVTGEVPVILRKGLITAEMIKSVADDCVYADELPNSNGEVRSPGMKYSHYCPNCKTALFKRDQVKDAITLYDSSQKQNLRVGFLADEQMIPLLGNRNILHFGKTDKQMAGNLYHLLRTAEQQFDLLISFEIVTDSELKLSVNNRFLKAFGKGK